MNKKNLRIIFGLILLISIAFISAYNLEKDLNSDGKISFNEWLKNIFGKISGNQILISCIDSDNGANTGVRGDCTDTQAYQDSCLSGSVVREYSCGKLGTCVYQDISCSSGQTCQNGKCASSIEEIEQIEAGEQIGATICIDADNAGASVSRGCLPFDCDDNDAEKFIGNTEICGDGKDNNCANGIDESLCQDKACTELLDAGNNVTGFNLS